MEFTPAEDNVGQCILCKATFKDHRSFEMHFKKIHNNFKIDASSDLSVCEADSAPEQDSVGKGSISLSALFHSMRTRTCVLYCLICDIHFTENDEFRTHILNIHSNGSDPKEDKTQYTSVNMKGVISYMEDVLDYCEKHIESRIVRCPACRLTINGFGKFGNHFLSFHVGTSIIYENFMSVEEWQFVVKDEIQHFKFAFELLEEKGKCQEMKTTEFHGSCSGNQCPIIKAHMEDIFSMENHEIACEQCSKKSNVVSVDYQQMESNLYNILVGSNEIISCDKKTQTQLEENDVIQRILMQLIALGNSVTVLFNSDNIKSTSVFEQTNVQSVATTANYGGWGTCMTFAVNVASSTTEQKYGNVAPQLPKLYSSFCPNYYTCWLKEFVLEAQGLQFPLNSSIYELMEHIRETLVLHLSSCGLEKGNNYLALVEIINFFKKIRREHLKSIQNIV